MRKIRFIVFLATVLLGLLPLILEAATTGEIFGIVRDEEGRPLPGVTVTVSSPALQGTRTATTDSAGEYRFPLLPPGQYQLSIAMSGFETLTRENVI
ncbi:MAG TPA: carboxypeptidase-like regulatory domain-containing protein, partial [Thermoanaerobaculia bacterium]